MHHLAPFGDVRVPDVWWALDAAPTSLTSAPIITTMKTMPTCCVAMNG